MAIRLRTTDIRSMIRASGTTKPCGMPRIKVIATRGRDGQLLRDTGRDQYRDLASCADIRRGGAELFFPSDCRATPVIESISALNLRTIPATAQCTT